ncbi:unnamed protein product [Sympodiomycopsis kandeliae]
MRSAQARRSVSETIYKNPASSGQPSQRSFTRSVSTCRAARPAPPSRFCVQNATTTTQTSPLGRWQTHHQRQYSAVPYDTPSPNADIEHCDAVILGGGVVGLAQAASFLSSAHLASATAATGTSLRFTLLDAGNLQRLSTWAQDKQTQLQHVKEGKAADVDWENRVVSLTADNWSWLHDTGVASYLVQHRIRPVHSMHVTDGLSGAAIDLGQASTSSNPNPLSYMVELTNLQQAMLRYIQAHNGESGITVDIWDQTKVQNIAPDQPPSTTGQYTDAWPLISTTKGDAVQQIRPRLLIGADGPSSPVRKYAGIEKYGWPYHRKGLVGTLRFRGVDGQDTSAAYQRFLKTGTVAWLPLSDTSASTVWALPPEIADTITALHRNCGNDTSIMADLINASWRLPWSSLATIFAFLPSIPAKGDTSHDFPDLISTLRHQIRSHIEAAEAQGTIIPESECPPLVQDVDLSSVASFPLSVAHTECYLGSSLSSPSFTPSSALHNAMSLTGFWTDQSDVPPSSQSQSQSQARSRTVLVGDAAHTIHPLAGQGLNLGLADVRSLCHTLEEATKVGGDWGAHESLKGYERDRYLTNQGMLSGVDHLFWLFDAGGETLHQARQRGGAQPSSSMSYAPSSLLAQGVVWARSTGMEVLNELDWVKKKIQQSAGSK